jgi:hypothetical protein
MKRKRFADQSEWKKHLPDMYSTMSRLDKRTRNVTIIHTDGQTEQRHPLDYPGPSNWQSAGRNLRTLQEFARRERVGDCPNARVTYEALVDRGPRRAPVPDGVVVEAEHPIDVSFMQFFLYFWYSSLTGSWCFNSQLKGAYFVA